MDKQNEQEITKKKKKKNRRKMKTATKKQKKNKSNLIVYNKERNQSELVSGMCLNRYEIRKRKKETT